MESDRLHGEVLPLRAASRELIRELGFLQTAYRPVGMAHSHCHAMIELEAGAMTQSDLAAKLRLDKSTTSRVVDRLVSEGWAKIERNPADRRQAVVTLTARGQAKLVQIHRDANGTVQRALDLLGRGERALVLDGMRLYVKALARSRQRARYTIRPLKKSDNPAVERIIKTVMPEFGANGPGFAIEDAEVGDMYGSYGKGRAAYFVVIDGKEVVGGGGVARLAGADAKTCELRKMYFLPAVRGLGLGQAMLDRCLDAARDLGFKKCYLETLEAMTQARALYERNGFKRLTKAMGCTGHFSCDAYYAKDL
jgi:putative acetyltransferase